MFIMLNFFGARTLNRKMLAERVRMLTEEAGLIAEEYVTPYYRDAAKLSDMLTQLRSVDRFLGTRTWVVNTNGVVIVDAAMEARGMNVDNLLPDSIESASAMPCVSFPFSADRFCFSHKFIAYSPYCRQPPLLMIFDFLAQPLNMHVTNGVVIVDAAMEARGMNVDNLDPTFLDRIVTDGYMTEVTFPNGSSSERRNALSRIPP